MNESSTNIPLACITAYELSFHPVYRNFQIYQLIMLFSSLFPLTYFILFQLLKSSFHGNLKSLLVGYFGAILVFSVVFLVEAFIQVLLPFISEQKCDLLIQPKYYKLGNLLGCLLMTIPTFFPISITFERLIATKMADDYEKTRVFLGPILAIFLVLLDLFLILLIYKEAIVTGGSISFVFIPASIASKMYMFFIMMLILNSFNFFFSFLLLRRNAQLKKSNSTLAAKFQLEEVYSSTKFSISVIFVHVTFFGSYTTITILLRYFGSYFFSDPIDLGAVRGAFMTMISSYNFAVGVASVYFNYIYRIKKIIEIKGNIRIVATGQAGAINYDKAIFNIWNSTSSTNNTSY
uniref:Serpentine receptor class beta-7 n=1 Tax=Caenorhabditis elegans TaxID=6239 RepID=SRB7_CAEEL|nr:RecName: Full=Serpentine receptor class beta-7; Short=Protein srb-7 [Caenorhabditis elegans]|eukprot:NP_498571.2 Serpentine receptor class beta-7 [Caenorhabditis elegans]